MDTEGKKIDMLRSVASNSIALLAARAFTPLSYFILTISIARILGVENYGMLSVVLAYHAVLATFALFGVDDYLMREVAADENRAAAFTGNAIILGAIFGVLSSVIMNALLYYMRYSGEILMVGFIISLIFLPFALTRFTETVFVALRRNWFVLFTTFARETIKIVTVLTALLVYKKLIPVVTAFCVVSYLGLAINLWVLKRYFFRLRIYFDKPLLKKIVKVSTSFMLVMVAARLFLTIDVLVLSRLKGVADVGLYSAAYKFIPFAFLFIDSVGTSLLPLLAKSYRDSKGEFTKLGEAFFKYFSILSFLFIIPVFFYADKIVFLIFGSEYVAAAAIVRVLIWMVFLNGSAAFSGRLLYCADMQRFDLLALAIACAVNFILNIWFTIKWGYIGTAAATVTATTILLGLQFHFFRTRVDRLIVSEIWLKPIAAALIFFITWLVLQSLNLHAWIPVSVIIYFAMLGLMRALNKEEILVIARAFFGKREE